MSFSRNHYQYFLQEKSTWQLLVEEFRVLLQQNSFVILDSKLRSSKQCYDLEAAYVP